MPQPGHHQPVSRWNGQLGKPAAACGLTARTYSAAATAAAPTPTGATQRRATS